MRGIFSTHVLFNILFIASLFLSVQTQTTHVVTVGLEGSFFTPPTLSAQLNDTVSFVFAGFKHSVTQCAFQTPCVPLTGGFNSGVAGRANNDSAPPLVWNLIITNVSEPIWYFCEVTMPTSHCASGMVGVINPPSIQLYEQFLSAAKLVNGTSPPSPSLILSGQGAFATASPTPSSSSITEQPTPSETTSSTSSISSTSSTSSMPSSSSTAEQPMLSDTASSSTSLSPSHQAAIIGGSIGGALIILGIITTLLVLRYRRSNTSHKTDFFFTDQNGGYRPTDTKPSAQSATAVSAPQTHHVHHPSIPSVLNIGPVDNAQVIPFPDTHENASPSNKTLRPLPRTPQQHSFALPDEDSRDSWDQTRHRVDSSSLTDLAREVATVLLETPPRRKNPPSSARRKSQGRYRETERHTEGDIPPEYTGRTERD